MNPSLQKLLVLADTVEPNGHNDRTRFEVYKDDELVHEGYFLAHSARDRQAFGQATGKLLNAGFEVTTFKESA